MTVEQELASAKECRLIGNVAEIVKDRLYFASVDGKAQSLGHSVQIFTYPEAHYESFYHDFGPYNLSVLYRFCVKLHARIKTTKRKPIVFCSPSDDESRVNCAFLIGAYALLYLEMSVEDAWHRVQAATPPAFVGFRDAAMGASAWDMSLFETLTAVQTAQQHGWLDFATFDADEYEWYERVENGDFNWILPGKMLAFCGPHQKSVVENGYPYHAPDVYFEYFRANNISTIIRLNKKVYDAAAFTRAGFQHIDLFFVDGSTPSDDIVRKFIIAVDDSSGGVAVHCKAGLGRTGTLIGCWMMKEYGITASECIAWMRICRPGCVIGPQQMFLTDKQLWCWTLGGWQHDGKHATHRIIEKSMSTNNNRNKHLKQLTSKVDDIQLSVADKQTGGTPVGAQNMVRPGTLVASPATKSRSALATGNGNAKDTANDTFIPESELDESTTCADADPGQGDRLLQAKAARQHEHDRQAASAHHGTQPSNALFTSPTTPVKAIRQASASTSMLARPTAPAAPPQRVARSLAFGEAPTKVARVQLVKSTGTSMSRTRLPPVTPTARTPSNSNTLSASKSISALVASGSSGLPPKPPRAGLSTAHHTSTTTRLHPYNLPTSRTDPNLYAKTGGQSPSSRHLADSDLHSSLPAGARVYALRPRPPPSTLDTLPELTTTTTRTQYQMRGATMASSKSHSHLNGAASNSRNHAPTMTHSRTTLKLQPVKLATLTNNSCSDNNNGEVSVHLPTNRRSK